MHCPVSWADTERDLTAWIGNEIQEAALKEIYDLERVLRNKRGTFSKKHTDDILDIWRKLQTSDQFYYMCTKYWADGDVHKYFSPYDSPYDAYISFMNVITDFKMSLGIENYYENAPCIVQTPLSNQNFTLKLRSKNTTAQGGTSTTMARSYTLNTQ